MITSTVATTVTRTGSAAAGLAPQPMPRPALRLRTGVLAAALLTLACGFSETATANTSQLGFTSPEQAAAALDAAWQSGSKADLEHLFGPAGIKLVSTGDAVAEKESHARLAAAYAAVHKIDMRPTQKAVLIIGTDEFPYPIPLVKHGKRWHFDTLAGKEEILDRRIGRNELNAIEVSRVYVEAQREYVTRDHVGKGPHVYAMKLSSSANVHDGLYWPVKPGEPESPLGPLMASAAAEGYGVVGSKAGAPYHGYYYKILTRQGDDASGGAREYVVKGQMSGGFALIAFPAKYADSGIKSFLVNQNGIVFEKDLGPDSARIARQMTAYNPDQTWKIPAVQH